MSFDELIHYVRLGGVTMAVILLSSVLALGVAIERLIALWGVGEASRNLGETLAKHLLRDDVDAARSAAERSGAVAADMFRAGFSRLGRGDVAGAVDRERVQVGLRLKKHLWILGTIGATTPFVGLFGTVAGIMRSFKELGLDVQAGGTGGPASVMTGISEALVATAAGILVAVEAVVFYNYFQARLARLNTELKLLAEEFVELIGESAKRRPTLAEAPSPAPSGTAGAEGA